MKYLILIVMLAISSTLSAQKVDLDDYPIKGRTYVNSDKTFVVHFTGNNLLIELVDRGESVKEMAKILKIVPDIDARTNVCTYTITVKSMKTGKTNNVKAIVLKGKDYNLLTFKIASSTFYLKKI